MKLKFTPPHVRNPKEIFKWWCRNIRLEKSRGQLKNKDFSILCNNCLGGMVTHDYYQPQLSPTVNLYMLPGDYIRFLKDLKENLKAEIKEIPSDKNYPVGEVNGCRLFFMHYRTFEEARQAWKRRAERINWNNLLVLLVERDGCTEDQLREFESLPFECKISFVHQDYQGLNHSFVVPGYSDFGEVGKITEWKGHWGKKEYDVINWIDILNNIQRG